MRIADILPAMMVPAIIVIAASENTSGVVVGHIHMVMTCGYVVIVEGRCMQ
jgi:putative Ca2+/H+ antiporter (TMEM165/GDT1 family)